MLRCSRVAPALLCFSASLIGASTALAQQFVAMDETWEHTPDLPDSHYRVEPSSETPADWTSPVDYSQGTAWVYMEVQTKPTEQETKFQVCFEATPTYACTAQSPTYTAVGTYEWATDFADFWSPPGELVDWSQGDNKLACILKDTMNNKPSADNVGAEVAALYTPTRIRMVVTIVAPGGTYEPPTPTGEGGGAQGGGGQGGAGTGGDASASGGASSQGGSGTGNTSSAGGDGHGGDGGGAPSPDEDDGCSMRTPANASNAWIAVAVVVLGAGARALRLRKR